MNLYYANQQALSQLRQRNNDLASDAAKLLAAGGSIGDQITSRIITPLGLRDTYWPDARDKGIKGPHPQGYLATTPKQPWMDVTTFDPSSGWAAGRWAQRPKIPMSAA